MFILATIIVMLFMLLVMLLLSGGTLLLVFGDVIVFAFVVWLLIKRFRNK